MSEQNGRLPSARAYHPGDHLVKIRTKEGLKDYYPASYRLYELTLRYPNANFTSEIVHLDVEHDFVIVKCCLYLGAEYSLSDKKTEALKQGRLSALDKVETAAKARCARDFGISTELALELQEEELETDGVEGVGPKEVTTVPVHPHEPGNRHQFPVSLDTVRALVWSAYHVAREQQTPQTWAKYKASVLGSDVPDALLSEAERARLHGHALGLHKRLEQHRSQRVVPVPAP